MCIASMRGLVHKMIAALALCLALGCGSALATAPWALADTAADSSAFLAPDLSRTGSITLSIVDPDSKVGVGGGAFSLYRVATVRLDNDADYSFELTEDFAPSGEALDTLDGELARRLSSYALANGLHEVGSLEVVDSGIVRFSDLDLGLYLLVQTKAADGYRSVSPFLVSLPLEEDGTLVYDVDASPKMETLTHTPEEPGEPEEPTTPEEPEEPANPEEPSTPEKPGTWSPIPSTGDVFNPLLVGGIVFVAVACIVVALILRRRK